MTEARRETRGGDDEQGEPEEVDRSHLDVEDGCGCAEVWEHLSDERAEAAPETKSAIERD